MQGQGAKAPCPFSLPGRPKMKSAPSASVRAIPHSRCLTEQRLVQRQVAGRTGRLAQARCQRHQLVVAHGRFHGKVEPEPLQARSEEHTSELQSPCNLVCRLLLEKKNTHAHTPRSYTLTMVSVAIGNPICPAHEQFIPSLPSACYMLHSPSLNAVTSSPSSASPS